MSSIMQYLDWHNNNYKSKIDIKRIDFKTGIYLPDTLSVNEITLLIDSLFHSNFIESRNKTILDFMYSTACRVSELCEVKISDIDFEDDYIKLTGKGNKQRLVPIGTELKVNLFKYIKFNNGIRLSPSLSLSGSYILQDNINESGGDLALKVNTKNLFNI